MLSKIQNSLKITGADKIARRYFVINSFDGVLTVIGILTGIYASGQAGNPSIIIATVLGATVAIAISGISGVYISEKAEHEEYLKTLENAMLTKLRKTNFGKAAKRVPIIIAMIDSLSSAGAAALTLLPAFLALLGVFPQKYTIHAMFALSAMLLFLLGAFLGSLNKQNIILAGLKTIAAGFATAIIIHLIVG